MATLVAEPEPLSLSHGRSELPGLRLDDSFLQQYAAAHAVTLNGKVRSAVVSDAEDERIDVDWLEPAPGLEPAVRRVAGLRVRSDHGQQAEIVAPVELYELPQGQLVRAVFYTLTLAIGTTNEWHILRWWLEPGGADATLRADALAFLETFHRPGHLEVVDDQGQRTASLRLPGAAFDPDLDDALSFITEVAALEEWSGTTIPLPLEAGAQEVADLSWTAAMVRARVVPLTLPDELELLVRPDGRTTRALSEVDAVVVPRQIQAQPLGVEIPLGTAEVAAQVEVVDLAERDDGFVELTCRLAAAQSRSVLAHLVPPSSRSRRVRRTLVGGAPLPPSSLLSESVAADLRQRALSSFLAVEFGSEELPAELLAGIEAKWPE